MSEIIIPTLVSIFSVVLGAVLGWFFARKQYDRNERLNRYHDILLDVRGTLLQIQMLLQDSAKRDSTTFGEAVRSYTMALGRLQPYEKWIGREDFNRLLHLVRGEMFHGQLERELIWAIRTIDTLASAR